MQKRVIKHLEELRSRIVFVVTFLILFFILGTLLSPVIIKRIIKDMSINGVQLVSLSPLEFIYTRIKIGLIIGFALTFPLLVYHAARFIKPGLRKKETALLRTILPATILLFVLGLVFSYFIFLKISVGFLANLSNIAGISNTWSVERFIGFIVGVCFFIGLIFEFPLVMWVLGRLGLIRASALKKKRAHTYVGVFILAAILTPPDAVTQILMAVPLIILFEISLLFVK